MVGNCSANTASQLCLLVPSSSILINLAKGDDVADGPAGHSTARLAAIQPQAAAPGVASLSLFVAFFLAGDYIESLFDSDHIKCEVISSNGEQTELFFCHLLYRIECITSLDN